MGEPKKPNENNLYATALFTGSVWLVGGVVAGPSMAPRYSVAKSMARRWRGVAPPLARARRRVLRLIAFPRSRIHATQAVNLRSAARRLKICMGVSDFDTNV